MALLLADLLSTPTAASVRDRLFSFLAANGFPVSSWQTGSVGRRFVEAESQCSADAFAQAGAIAAGGYLDTATGDWLTLLAHSHYAVEKYPAVFARGTAVLTDAAGAGPYVIAPQSLWAASTSGRRFQNATGATLPQNGTLALTWQAESPGSAWNVPVGALTSLVTSLPGVTLANPSIGRGAAAWLTQVGNEAEADEAVRIRCRARWPTLGTGATALVYEGWARSASAEVQKVKVFGNTPSAGQVTVVGATAAGGLSSGALAAMVAYITPRTPLCVVPNIFSASQVTVPVVATLYVRAAYAPGALAAALTQLTAYQAAQDIGATVYLAALIEQLMLAPGAVNVVVSSPPGDVSLSPTQIAVLAPSLSLVAA